MKTLDLELYWNKAYENKDTKKLGWYEDCPEPSLQLIKKCNLNKEARLLNVGVGTTTLIDELIKLGYKNIIGSDISSTAVEKIKQRIGPAGHDVKWIIDDLTNSKKLIDLRPVDLWNDRAVLHFFDKTEDQDAYFYLLNKLVKQNGFVIIAAFNLSGAIKCSGLPVFRYNQEMLEERLGNDFQCLDSFDFIYTMPGGEERPYIYTLFQRTI
jgi:cyclopropane fatty-acyl-phospholipid synthase-like methyltransferase